MLHAVVGYPFDASKSSSSQEVDDLVAHLLIVLSFGYKRKPKNNDLGFALKCVLLNLFNVRLTYPNAYIFYSRQAHDYSSRRISFRTLIRVVDGLEKGGYIETETGQWHGTAKRGERSKMRSNRTLLSLYAEFGIRPSMISSLREHSLIVLRDQDKQEIALPDDVESRVSLDQMRTNLVQLNGAIASAFVGLHIPDEELHILAERMANSERPRYVDFSKKSLYRVFNNGSLESGGRFVGGWWQSIPKEMRKYIHISHARHPNAHRRVAEIDYSAMHPSIAYALVGQALDFDPYDVSSALSHFENFDSRATRKVAKMTLNALLNAGSIDRGIKAIRSDLVKLRDRNGVQTGKPYEPPGCPPIDKLAKELLELNHVIAEFIGSGSGVRLMNIESKIAEQTMMSVVNISGAAVLPVHDSFLIRQSHVEDLEKSMRNAFEMVLRVPCKVDLDPMESLSLPGELPEDASVMDLHHQRISFEKSASTFFTMWEDWKVHNVGQPLS